jgi:hypothetical protein
MYQYFRLAGIYEIFKVENGVGTKTGDYYFTKEEARKRVYELNGWNYSKPNNN